MDPYTYFPNCTSTIWDPQIVGLQFLIVRLQFGIPELYSYNIGFQNCTGSQIVR